MSGHQPSDPPEIDVTGDDDFFSDDNETSRVDLSNEPASSHGLVKEALKPIPADLRGSVPVLIRPLPGELTDTQCEDLASMLRTIPSHCKHLDLSRNSVKETGAELLFAALRSPHCDLKTLRLGDCVLSEKSWASLGSALMNHVSLKELDLSGNKYLTDSGLKVLFDRLRLGQCRPCLLRLVCCNLTESHCDFLASELKLTLLRVFDLDLSGNYLQDSGVKLLCSGLTHIFSLLRTLRISLCSISQDSCDSLALLLKSHYVHLKELDLSLNQLGDSGLKKLCAGLGDLQCHLRTLRLIHCHFSDEGCASLASALKSNYCLTELDLSGNELQHEGIRLLSEFVSSPDCRLMTLRVDSGRNLITVDSTAYTDWFEKKGKALEDAAAVAAADNIPGFSKQGDKQTESELFPSDDKTTVLQRRWSRATLPVPLIKQSVNLQRRMGTLKKLVSIKQKRQEKSKHPSTPDIDIYTDWFEKKREAIEAVAAAVAATAAAADNIPGFSKQGDKQTESELFPSDDKTTASLPPPLVTETTGNLEATNTNLDSSEERTDSSVKQVPSHFTPTMFKERGNISYRFRGPCPGVYRCELTRLMFTMTGEGELSYRIVQWDREFLQVSGKVAAGPLYDIKCPEATVSQLHLPHCETQPALLSGCLSVVHISDDGMSFTEPLEITETHAVVDVPHLSAFGLVWDIIKRFLNIQKPILGQVHLFYNPKFTRKSQKINVFLLTENVPLQEVKEQQKHACAQNTYFEAPSTCYLIKDQTYAVHCPEALKVQPDCAPFIFNYGPNYSPTFELRLASGTEEATVTVQDQEKRPVWKYQLDLTSLTSASSSAAPSVLLPVPATEQASSSASVSTASEPAGGQGPDPSGKNPQRTGEEETKLSSVRTEFIDRVSNPVLNNLLDVLLQHEVINNSEMESIQILQRENKARQLIQTVLNKGNPACVILIKSFCEADPFLSKQLGLNGKKKKNR